jgi:hypothetical protein
VRRGDAAAAEAELRGAIDINMALVGADSWRTARAQASLAWALIQRGDAREGEPMLVAARTKLLGSMGPKDPATLWAGAHLAQYLRAHHRDAEAAAVQASVP